MFSLSIINEKIAYYLTLKEYPSCSRTSKAFKLFSKLILREEARYFGFEEEMALSSFKAFYNALRREKTFNNSFRSILFSARMGEVIKREDLFKESYFPCLIPHLRLDRSALLNAVKGLCKAYCDYEESLPYFEAAFKTKESLKKIGHYQILIKWLIKNDDKACARQKGEAFEFCLENKEYSIAKFLKEQGINPLKHAFSDANSYLHMAMRHAQEWMLDDIDHFDHLINAQNDNGETPLHLAMKNRFMPGIFFLLSFGADPLIKDKSGKKPIDYYPDLANTKMP